MNELREGAGWYADPAGTNELRYFDGHWTDQVATRGPSCRQAASGRGASRAHRSLAPDARVCAHLRQRGFDGTFTAPCQSAPFVMIDHPSDLWLVGHSVDGQEEAQS